MDGAEQFDFFRQPEFVKDPYLAGSYAVYKKETPVGEGTGKLCHIHRPEIIDSRGRRCWGDLSVIGNELRITIPENWLSEAKYPVVVDPTIGTTTVGSQNEWIKEAGEDPESLYFLAAIAVNRFLVPQAINGNCTAYAYCNEDDGDGGGRPVLYSDNSSKPLERRSKAEGLFDFGMNGSKPPGWRTASFQSNRSITAGTYVWFGVLAELYWYPRFDYGVVCYTDTIDDYDPVPEIYPLYNANVYDNFKLSMYFTYSSAQNYTRTITQGVNLTDTRKRTATYKRAMAMNAKGITLLGHSSNYFREQLSAVHIADTVSRFRGFFRFITEQLKTGDFISCCRDFLRTIAVTVKPETREQRSLSVRKGIVDEAGTEDSTARERGFIRTLAAAVSTGDYAGKVITLFRGIREEVSALGEAGHLGDYIRGLYTEAGSMAETKHKGKYYRTVEDTAGNTGVSLRHLCIFLRIVTLSLVRDYLIPRFLRSREELVIKSPITRELELESRIR
jgi:hypothetical protein